MPKKKSKKSNGLVATISAREAAEAVRSATTLAHEQGVRDGRQQAAVSLITRAQQAASAAAPPGDPRSLLTLQLCLAASDLLSPGRVVLHPSVQQAPPPARKSAEPRSNGAAVRVKGQKRDPAEIAATVVKLGSHIKAHPGSRIEEIGKALDTPTKDLNLPVKKLMSDRRIRSKGVKRATRYYPA